MLSAMLDLTGRRTPVQPAARLGVAVFLAASVALAAAACTKSTTSPSSSTTTTAPATTTVTTTSATTTSVQATFTVSGRVTSDKTGASLPFPVFEIISGVNINRRLTGNQDGTYSMTNLQPGTFVMRAWADGYFVKDLTITITTSNVTLDIQLTPAPPPTTTTPVTPLHASFTWSPNPCTIDSGNVVTCVVDGSASTGLITPRTIVQYHWAYAGQDVLNSTSFNLSVPSCGAFQGSGVNVSLKVRLTVVDDQGNADTLEQGIPFTKLNGACP
jgi:hypothetical protein